MTTPEKRKAENTAKGKLYHTSTNIKQEQQY